MAFGDARKNSTASQAMSAEGFYESPFVKFVPGERVLRVLDTDAITYFRYFLKVNFGGDQRFRSINVGGYHNPVKEFMDNLGEDHPDYARPQKRYIINVLDRTPVKKTEKGVTVLPGEGGKYPAIDPTFNEDVSSQDPVPNNRVMILEMGITLYDNLVDLSEAGIRSPDTYEVMTIHDFDVRIRTKGQGRDRRQSVIASTESSNDFPSDAFTRERYDLQKIIEPLPDELLKEVLEGGDYMEILDKAGRKPGNYPMYNPDPDLF